LFFAAGLNWFADKLNAQSIGSTEESVKFQTSCANTIKLTEPSSCCG
jgi:hypothetical protein